MPVTEAPGQRSASRRVTLPGPQPRSETVRGLARGDLRQQVECRAQALVGEFQVLARIPGRHFVLPRALRPG
jgi:hypothetical protein